MAHSAVCILGRGLPLVGVDGAEHVGLGRLELLSGEVPRVEDVDLAPAATKARSRSLVFR